MKVSGISLSRNTTSKQGFSGKELVFKPWYHGRFQALTEASKEIISELGEKYDVKMVFEDRFKKIIQKKPWSMAGKVIDHEFDSLLSLEIREINKSKSKVARWISDKLYKPFKAEKSILEDSMKALQNKKHHLHHNIDLVDWLKRQEINFLALQSKKEEIK